MRDIKKLIQLRSLLWDNEIDVVTSDILSGTNLKLKVGEATYEIDYKLGLKNWIALEVDRRLEELSSEYIKENYPHPKTLSKDNLREAFIEGAIEILNLE